MSILPDMIFMDINMPLMNGLDCLKKLKRISRFNDIPVVILTASSNVYGRQLPFMLEASSYLSKPADSMLLKNNITEMINRHISPTIA